MVDHFKLVRYVLERHPDAKDSDFRLFGWCCAYLKPDIMNLPFKEVMWKHKELGIPSFETIRRTRQKLQQNNPELRGKAYRQRQKAQEEYRETFGRM